MCVWGALAGGLRAEKVASAAALKKQEVRLAHLESMVTQLTQQVLKLGCKLPSVWTVSLSNRINSL